MGEDAEVEAQPTALVTGAAGHIGGALLPLLTAAGLRTIGVDRPGSVDTPPETTRADRWIAIDLADAASEAELTAALRSEPRLDLVVAAAGVTALGDLASTSDDVFERVMAVNYHWALRDCARPRATSWSCPRSRVCFRFRGAPRTSVRSTP